MLTAMRDKNEGTYRRGDRYDTRDHGLSRRSLRVEPPTSWAGKLKWSIYNTGVCCLCIMTSCGTTSLRTRTCCQALVGVFFFFPLRSYLAIRIIFSRYVHVFFHSFFSPFFSFSFLRFFFVTFLSFNVYLGCWRTYVFHVWVLYIHLLFERSEFLIDTSQKKSLHVCRVPCAVCTCARVQ